MTEKTGRILIIDDEKPMARAAQLKLEHEGFKVDVAYDGEEGLSMIDKEQYDAILLDLVMPKKDGFYVLEELKKRGNTAPVMFLSNLSQQEDEVRAKELGASEFYIKSNTPITQIVEKVKTFL